MEFLIAIALLCNQQDFNKPTTYTHKLALECQQSYIHCVNVKTSMTKQDALERCILEKK